MTMKPLCFQDISNSNGGKELNSTSTVLMVEPVNFKYNEQTATTNAFMKQEADSIAQREALEQFNNYVDILRRHGINVITVKDAPEPSTPDSIFPNNWFSTHSDGHTVLYPMCAPNRRDERKPGVMDAIAKACPNNTVVDLTHWESEEKILKKIYIPLINTEKNI